MAQPPSSIHSLPVQNTPDSPTPPAFGSFHGRKVKLLTDLPTDHLSTASANPPPHAVDGTEDFDVNFPPRPSSELLNEANAGSLTKLTDDARNEVLESLADSTAKELEEQLEIDPKTAKVIIENSPDKKSVLSGLKEMVFNGLKSMAAMTVGFVMNHKVATGLALTLAFTALMVSPAGPAIAGGAIGAILLASLGSTFSIMFATALFLDLLPMALPSIYESPKEQSPEPEPTRPTADQDTEDDKSVKALNEAHKNPSETTNASSFNEELEELKEQLDDRIQSGKIPVDQLKNLSSEIDRLDATQNWVDNIIPNAEEALKVTQQALNTARRKSVGSNQPINIHQEFLDQLPANNKSKITRAFTQLREQAEQHPERQPTIQAILDIIAERKDQPVLDQSLQEIMDSSLFEDLNATDNQQHEDFLACKQVLKSHLRSQSI